MPDNAKNLDKQDANALFNLFQIVTGVDPDTVVMGSANVVKVDDDAHLIFFHTIDMQDDDRPEREHIVQIVPGHPVQEEL